MKALNEWFDKENINGEIRCDRVTRVYYEKA